MTPSKPQHPQRIAFNEVITPEGQCLTRYVVELSGQGMVSNLYPLQEEQAFTQWRQGQATLRNEDGGMVVYYHGKKLE